MPETIGTETALLTVALCVARERYSSRLPSTAELVTTWLFQKPSEITRRIRPEYQG
jgi:hypothetical protein